MARFEALAGDLLDELGYERRFHRVPLGKRVAAWRGVLMDGVALAVKRLRKRRRRG